MNSGLEKLHVIDSTKLQSELYFQSLLEEAGNKGLLSDSNTELIQYQCLTLLADKTERYNSGDSSSIRIEKAQDIMTSILFTIGVALKAYPNPDDAAAALQQNPINEIYQKGRDRIDNLLATAKAIHTKLLHQLVDTQNHFYRDTFADGILGFFKLYYPDFSAHEIHITADYPLFNPIPKLLGVEFIRDYVEGAYRENQFCRYFAAEDIHHLLCGYAEDYHGLVINIYEQVLTAAIGCIVAGVDCSRLDITEAGVRYLCHTFTAQSESEIFAAITKAAGELSRRFQFAQGLTRYIENSLPLIASNIEVAAVQCILNRIFFIPAFPENNPQIIFSYGKKMDDGQYRRVIAEIIRCRYIQDKIAIIKEYVHSFADLEDVLLDSALTVEELGNVLTELSLYEIAALYKKYQPVSDNSVLELREQEHMLRMSLQSYISSLPQPQQKLIGQASKALWEE